MSSNIKKDLLVKAGLGEEVLSSMKKEKYISKVAERLQEMMDGENTNVDEMARQIVDIIIKDKNDEQF